MKRYIKDPKYISAAKTQSTGPFWYIPDEDKLIAFPYDPNELQNALSNNGLTYTHKRLWPEIAGQYRSKPYNYYPRGRVETKNNRSAVVYMNPNIGEDYIKDIMEIYRLSEYPSIKYDYSKHYKCYLDVGWKAEGRR